MIERQLDVNVYDAFNNRLAYLFSEFDNIYVSFSGGKDSGLMLNLSIDYMRKNKIDRKLIVFHQDFEAQYSATTDYVTEMLLDPDNQKYLDIYWCCMPCKSKTAISMHEQYWTPWDPSKNEIWVRDMPMHDCIVNIDNHEFDFYHTDITQEDFYAKFAQWLGDRVTGSLVNIVGIRADESLNRRRAIHNSKHNYDSKKWIVKSSKKSYNAYPIYDWSIEDVWICHAKNDFKYNRIYDLFYMAGLPVGSMRVASPFNDWATSSLSLYRTIEPSMWSKMVGRVNGANFTSIYGDTKAFAWKKIKLPDGHTWKSYCEFLLKTLPEDTRETYKQKFETSIKFWRDRGGVLSDETIDELTKIGINCNVGGLSNYKTDKSTVTFDDYPDDADVADFSSVPSYKRMCICILKNDHLCKFMGFSQTKIETEKRRNAIEKYKLL